MGSKSPCPNGIVSGSGSYLRLEVLQHEIDKCNAITKKLNEDNVKANSALKMMEADVERLRVLNPLMVKYEAALDKKIEDLQKAYNKLEQDMKEPGFAEKGIAYVFDHICLKKDKAEADAGNDNDKTSE